MRTRSILGMGALGLALGGAAGVADASRRARDRAISDFVSWGGPAKDWPSVDGIPVVSPAYVNHVELFGAFYPADAGAVARDLPSERLHPVRLPDGRALLFVAGLHYRDITNPGFTGGMAPPYGEVMIAAMATRGVAPPLLPLAGGVLPIPKDWRAGMTPLFVPVTHRWARDAAWAMGIPKFIADLDFDDSPTSRAISAAEGGRLILRLRVPAVTQTRVLAQRMLTFAAHEGTLYEVDSPAFAHGRMAFRGSGAELELGDHEVSDHLRDLGLTPRAIGTLVWTTGRLILPDRVPVGTARQLVRFRGSDRWLGRYTIRYPGTAPVDQYAYLTRDGVEQAIVRGGGTPQPDYEQLDDELGPGAASREPGALVTLAGRGPD